MSSWKQEDILTGFLFLCVICHGMFFVREWLILGTALITYRAVHFVHKYKSKQVTLEPSNVNIETNVAGGTLLHRVKALFKPAVIFMAMIALSLSGLLNPIRPIEGWLEAFRWLIFMTAYFWGRELSVNAEANDRILNRLILIALLSTVITWLPYSDRVWLPAGPPEAGRFAATFGYPNALAVFLGSMLIVLLKDKTVNLFLLIFLTFSLISTGSRAAVLILICLYTLLIIKRIVLGFKDHHSDKSEVQLGFYKGAVWGEFFDRKKSPIIRILLLILVFVLLQHTLLRFQTSLSHLVDWTGTSLPERFVYYLDSIRISWYAHFLPQAGGWFAFPFIQSLPYWTLDPHSSFCRILLNQGLAGVLLLGVWLIRGIIIYCKDLIWSSDLRAICSKTAALYIGLHSLLDVDMSFGAIGILFWLLIGMNRH